MKKLSYIIIPLFAFVCFSCNNTSEKNNAKENGKDSINETVKTQSKQVEKRTDIKEAFDLGKLELKFTALENGKVLEISVLNLTTDPLSLFIAVGTTSFTENIAIITTEKQNIDIPAKEKSTFKVNQKPGGMIGGSVTMRKNLKK
ncbi:MAG: hypothetical protein NTU98_02805 [Bacteroidetes bacterium]|nr:hypothetical protein [Bacteroidota bacterium]